MVGFVIVESAVSKLAEAIAFPLPPSWAALFKVHVSAVAAGFP